MNIVSIDPSLISTALVIGNSESFKIFNYCRESKVYGKKGMTKWYKMAEEYVNYKFIEYRDFDNYSEGEIIKLKDYDSITDNIIKDILDNINHNEKTIIGIEGYSFSSAAGDIIDLVTFSTLLRKKLFDRVSENIVVLSPSTLKLESCKLTYTPIAKEVGKKVKRIEYEYRNNEGMSGGKFTKTEMFKCIVENNHFNDFWFNHCLKEKEEILSTKNINKPHEDLNDAYLIYQFLRKGVSDPSYPITNVIKK